MRLLLTNDDGIQSIGLAAMAAALRDADHDVTIVAPSTDRSGASASLGRIVPKDRMIVTPTTIDNGGRRLDAATMDAPPGLIAMAAALGAFGDPPDVVVSGINLGPNTGHAILHSGTVGAVLTAQNFGVPGLAVSVAESERWWTETAAPIAPSACSTGSRERPPRPTVVNLNVPALPPEDVGDVRVATLDRFGSVRAVVASSTEGLEFEFRSTSAELDPASDTALLADGHPTVTALDGLAQTALDDVPTRADLIESRVTRARRPVTSREQ
jgi:5'-nucleotidase